MIKNEKGYSLLLTLILIILFTILGASLIAVTFNGTHKNQTREEIVQSGDLANKGIDRIAAQITAELNSKLNNGGISASNYIKEFNLILNKYKCSGGAKITDTASLNAGTDYSVCIYKIQDDPESEIIVNSLPQYLRKVLTFQSTGRSNDKSGVQYAKFNIGATKYPEVLNYAVGAYKIPLPRDAARFPNIPGEGNLILNGGASIEGDIKVDGNLITSDNGIWRSTNSNNMTSDYSVPSVLPQLSGITDNISSKISIEGNMYKFNHYFNGYSTSFNYSKHINSELLTNTTFYTKTNNIEQLFSGTTKPKLFESSLTVKPIDFTAKKSSLHLSATTQNRYDTGRNKTIDSLNYSNKDAYLMYEKCTLNIFGFCLGSTEYDYSGTYSIKGTNSFRKLGTSGNLLMTTTKTSISNGAYVGGNLEIKNSTKANPSRISGSIYVEKDLTIENAYLESDVIFYVNGDVSITESQIFGIPYSDRTGSLIIFAKGNINLSNNSVDSPTPSEFKGYFYSEQTMEMYGVGSNIKINGGISARKIILNAVRGTANKSNYQSKDIQQTLDKTKSRLQIIYDKDIIKNFSELEIQIEPWIDNVSPPVELERSYTPPN